MAMHAEVTERQVNKNAVEEVNYITVVGVEFTEVPVDEVKQRLPGVDTGDLTMCPAVRVRTTDSYGIAEDFLILVRYMKREFKTHFEALRGARLEKNNTRINELLALKTWSCNRVRLTPYEALILLARNWMNRPCDFTNLRRYVRDIAEREWLLTNVAIGINTLGGVVDGQHRLFGCLFARLPIEIAIMTGLDPRAKMKVDTGVVRTPRQIVNMHKPDGTPDGSKIYPMLRLIFGCHGGNTARINTDDLLNDLMDHYADDLRWIAPLLPTKRRRAKSAGNAAQDVLRREQVRTAFLIFHHVAPTEAQSLLNRLMALNFEGSEPAKAISRYIGDPGQDDALTQMARLLTGCLKYAANAQECDLDRVRLSKRGTLPKGVNALQRRFDLMATQVLQPLWAQKPLLPTRVARLLADPARFSTGK